MTDRLTAGAAWGILIAWILACGGGAPTPAPDAEPATAPAASAPAATWQTLKTWSGSGMKDTETFETASREWRITWKTSNEPFAGAGILQIYVHDANTDALINLAANKQGVGGDTSYVRAPPGRYYLKISSGNADWTVTVEDQR